MDNPSILSQVDTINVTEPGLYTVTIMDTTTPACTSSHSVLVVAPPSLSITPSGEIFVCTGESVLLTANTNAITTQYQWFYNGALIENTDTQSITASLAGIYAVKVTDLTTRCSAMSASVTIGVGPCFSLALFQCCDGTSDDVASLTTAVKNNGKDAAPAVAVTVDIPKWLTFVGGEPSTWTFTQSGTTVTARYNQPLLAGQIEAFTIDAKVNGKRDKKRCFTATTSDTFGLKTARCTL